MKTIHTYFFTILFFTAFSFQSFSQSEQIVADSKPFEYLIGMEYFTVSDLGDFTFRSGGTRTTKDGIKNGYTNLHFGTQQIITSEFIEKDTISSKEMRRIVDLVVLNELTRICHGCLLSKKENVEIMTVHSWGSKELSRNSILAAFEIDYKTGKYKRTKPKKYKWREIEFSGLLK